MIPIQQTIKKYWSHILLILVTIGLIYSLTNTNTLKEDIKLRTEEINDLKQQIPELLMEADSSQDMTIKFKDKYYVELSKIPELKQQMNEVIEDVDNTPDSVLLQWAVDRYKSNN